MRDRSFTTSFTVDQTPEAVFAAITNVRGWWSEDIAGRTDTLGAFDYRFRDIHRCKVQVTELVPGRKVAWHVLENRFNFTDDATEWTGTEIVFDAIAESPAAIEINGDPHRLDLAPHWIREARRRGIRFVVSTDAHSTGGLRNVRWAVDMARRGWLRTSDVLNTLGPAEFAAAVHP